MQGRQRDHAMLWYIQLETSIIETWINKFHESSFEGAIWSISTILFGQWGSDCTNTYAGNIIYTCFYLQGPLILLQISLFETSVHCETVFRRDYINKFSLSYLTPCLIPANSISFITPKRLLYRANAHMIYPSPISMANSTIKMCFVIDLLRFELKQYLFMMATYMWLYFAMHHP